MVEKNETSTRDQTLEFLKYESEHSSMVHPTTLTTDTEKVKFCLKTIKKLYTN